MYFLLYFYLCKNKIINFNENEMFQVTWFIIFLITKSKKKTAKEKIVNVVLNIKCR